MITPFPFQHNLKEHFKNQSKTWNWFNEQATKTPDDTLKTELLKNAYRIDPNEEPTIYSLLEKAKDKLGIILPIIIYQSQFIEYNNAQIYFSTSDAHIILSGSILKLLNDDELVALFGHELSHILFYSIDNKEYEITSRIINAIANDYRSDLVYLETARIFQLYLELYCDIGALKASGNRDNVINTLIKLNTGLEKVSAQSYLKQADEILEKINEGSVGETHPETYIRAKALQIYDEQKDDYIKLIENLIRGKSDLHQLHLFTKEEINKHTKRLVDILLNPKWTQSEFVMVLYKQYFNIQERELGLKINEEIKTVINDGKNNIKDYYAYILLDFALCDSELKEPFIGHILDIAEQLLISKNLINILKKELKLSEKAQKEFLNKCMASLNQILESEKENTY